MILEIKMPKHITTIEQFYEWRKSQTNDKKDLEVYMKRRTNFYPFDFTKIDNGEKVHYLISDSVSSGSCQVKNFNKVFKFVLRTV